MQAKQKRIKKVFNSSSEVLHLWAAQSQPEARQAGSGGNGGWHSPNYNTFYSRCYFEGLSCYSYGKHYELGRLVTINKRSVALINTSGYSVTTRKHIGEAKRAVSHLPIIEVDEYFNWERGLVKMQDELISDLFNMLNRRSFWVEHSVYRQAQFTEFNNLCCAVGMPQLRLFPDAETLAVIQAHVDKCVAREKVLNAAKQAKREEERINRMFKHADEIEAWKLGGEFTDALYSVQPQIIRVKDNEVQTSGRATVSLPDAKAALRALLKGELKQGDKIGSYEFEKLSDGIVTIGCHNIRLDDAKALLMKPNHLKLVGAK